MAGNLVLFCRELEELEAIKEAEEAALAEAEAAAAEAAEAMEGLFGGDGPDLDDPGGNNSPDSPSGKGPLVDVVSGGGSASRGSLISATATKYAVAPGSVRDHAFSQSVDGMNNANDDSERISVSSAPYRSEISLDQPHHHHHHHRGSMGISASGNGGSSRLSSLPASPFVRRTSKSNSFSSHVRLHEKYGNSKKPLVLFTYLDAQEHLPYADDSTAVTPKSELNGGIVVDTPTRMGLSRKLSYNSHCGKVDSYNSHTDLRYPPNFASSVASNNTKEGILTKRMATLFSEKPTTPNSILLDPITDSNVMADNLDHLHQRKCSNSFINNGKDSVDLQVSFFSSIKWPLFTPLGLLQSKPFEMQPSQAFKARKFLRV